MSSDVVALALQQTLYESRNPTRRYLHRSRRRWIEAVLSDVAPVGRAAELGPGSGIYLAPLADCAERVVALDVRAAFLRAARQRPEVRGQGARVSFVQAELQAIPLTEGSIDLLLCSEVIEHLADSASALCLMAKLLAPGGQLVLTTPQAFSPLELLGRVAFLPGLIQLLRWIYREPIEATGHINLLTSKQLAEQLKAAGLEVQQAEYIGLYLPGLAEFGGAWGQRLLARLEKPLRASPLRWMLWTQCYVLAKSPVGARAIC